MDGALTGMIIGRIRYSTWVVSEVPSAGSGVVGAAPCTWTGGLPEESRHEVNLHATPLASLRCVATTLLSSYSASKQNVLLHPPESIKPVS